MGVVVVVVLSVLAVLALVPGSLDATEEANYLVGRGIADATGPVAEINMMGYMKYYQKTAGIHLRLFSRAFIVEDRETGIRVVYVCLDAAMISQLLKKRVVVALKDLYGDMYDDTNVLITATHTHSGPGGYMQYFIYQASSLGFYEPSLQSLVNGVVESITRAHDSMVPGKLFFAYGFLDNAGVNRSPTAYLRNPEWERTRYLDGDTDKEMLVLKMTDADDRPLGMINWFPLHANSMNYTNQLISSDNKGYASILFEEYMDPGSFPGKGSFVAAFPQTSHGDVSPNVHGPRCQDTGGPCNDDNTCSDGTVQYCIASGPGEDMYESTRILAERMANKAKEIFNSTGTQLFGPVDFRMSYVNMTNRFTCHNGRREPTCKAAMGFSMAAGTSDGPGEFDFVQGDTHGSWLWEFARNQIQKPSNDLIVCHLPKRILLATGETDWPYPWQADIVDFQILRIGQLVIVGIPGELTTMAGRRLYFRLQEELLSEGFTDDLELIINGMTNSYMNYVATFEEYEMQRYEGASTSYGPHTLEAITDILVNMTALLAKNETVDRGTPPPDLTDQQIDFISPVFFDTASGWFKSFGSVWWDVEHYTYLPGETANVYFRSGNPRNSDPRTTAFLTVEQQLVNGTWIPIRTEAHWDTEFRWKRTSWFFRQSWAHLAWTIPLDQEPGTYRFVHRGHYKQFLTRAIRSYYGYSSSFDVVTSK